jgi:hypothetical protein
VEKKYRPRRQSLSFWYTVVPDYKNVLRTSDIIRTIEALVGEYLVGIRGAMYQQPEMQFSLVCRASLLLESVVEVRYLR